MEEMQNLLGSCLETLEPFQGPVEYRSYVLYYGETQDVLTWREAHYLLARCEAGEEVEIVRVDLDSGGYNRWGRYYGAGMPLFTLYCCGRTVDVRARDRHELRAHLRRMYPHLKMSR